MASRYWVGGTDSWDTTAGTKWATTSGGTGGASVPGFSDDVYFDSNSTGTVTLSTLNDTPCRSLDIKNFAGTFAYNASPTAIGLYNNGGTANLILGSNVTYPENLSFVFFGNGSITSNSSYFGLLFTGFSAFDNVATINLNDDLHCGGIYFGYTGNTALQTFTTNNYNVTTSFMYSYATPLTINAGSSLFTLDYSGKAWWVDNSTTLTFNAGASTIKLTGNGVTFGGAGKTYATVWFAPSGTSAITIQGSNTFQEFKDTGTSAHTIKFTAGTTQTIGVFSVQGSAGNLISLDSTSTATYNLVKSGALFYTDYLNIQHCVATPSSTWYAGANSVNNQSVATAGSGWIFSGPPTTWTNQSETTTTFTNISKTSSTFTNQTPSSSSWTNQTKN
jgi:hypothetical protein